MSHAAGLPSKPWVLTNSATAMDGHFGSPAKDNMYDHGAILAEVVVCRLPAKKKNKYWVLTSPS